MISLSDYASRDGLGLAELVARKQVTPQELVAAALEPVTKVNPKLNALLHAREAGGGRAARRAEACAILASVRELVTDG